MIEDQHQNSSNCKQLKKNIVGYFESCSEAISELGFENALLGVIKRHREKSARVLKRESERQSFSVKYKQHPKPKSTIFSRDYKLEAPDENLNFGKRSLRLKLPTSMEFNKENDKNLVNQRSLDFFSETEQSLYSDYEKYDGY